MRAIFLTTVLVCLCSCTLSTSEDKNPKQRAATDEELLRLGDELYNSFPKNGDNCVYPRYFGGSYIDEGCLVVLIKNMSKKGMEDINEMIGDSSFLKFKNCQYSLQELQDVKKKLDDVYFNNTSLRNSLKWHSVGINIIKNRVTVYLENLSAKNIERFKKKLMDSPVVVYEGAVDTTM